MSSPTLSTTPPLPLRAMAVRLVLRSFVIGAGISAIALVTMRHPTHARPLHVSLHGPNLSLIAHAPLAVRIHLLTIAGAILVAAILFSGVKGNRLHRVLGWSWVSFMLITAVSALFIQPPPGMPHIGGFGILHLFSAMTLIQAPLGVWAARTHDVNRHARLMAGLAIGGLGIAGLFAFIPGRLMWQVFFG